MKSSRDIYTGSVNQYWINPVTSQRSLHYAPIFRLLLKVAVNGTHQCDFLNFCGAPGLQQHATSLRWLRYDLDALYSYCLLHNKLCYISFGWSHP